jgi:alpha-mannosidase
VLNDCKYGYDAQGTTLRLTILRAPTWPWDGADIGMHHLRYGFLLHHGIEAVPAVAEAFNHPLVLRSGGDGDGADLSSLVTPKTDGIAVEAVKLSEDGTALIVRLWERFGRSQQAQITLASDILSADLADMLEKSQETLELVGGDVAVSFKPFEIKTLRLTWKAMS